MILALVIWIITLAIISLYDKRKYSTPYTPTIIMGGPLFCTIVISILINPYIKYIDISGKSILILLFGVVVFWFGGIVAKLLYNSLNRHTLFNKKIEIVPSARVNILFFIFLVIILANLNNLLGNRTLDSLEDQEFANNGIVAHLNGYTTIFIIIFSYSYLKFPNYRLRIFYLIAIVLVLILKILT